ncbi:hypothetical protein K6U06_13110 [Acidiferrimicrobium sp. IK]|nr:hypothetical protein [Acidiferrimicrobium sp. IK]
MAGAVLGALAPSVAVETAGTLTVEGQPVSFRTRAALGAIGLKPGSHRSRQATASDLQRATLVIGLAPEHVAWVRREHPAAAGRTATLRRLERDLPAGGPLAERVAGLGLAGLELEAWEEVVDPGGGEVEEFTAAAIEIDRLVRSLAPRLG